MWNCVSSSWFERLRISDRKFVNHTTEMILWSMILKVAIRAVGVSRGQPNQLVLMEFDSASLERHWALIVVTFHFCFGAPWLKEPSRLLLHKLQLRVSDLTTTGGKSRCQRHLYHVLCTLDFRIKHVRAHFLFIPANTGFSSRRVDEKLSHSPQVMPEKLLVSMKPSEIDVKDDISHPPVGVLVFSFQLAITPPL